VVAVVKLANQHRLPLYPISTGRNWGYGSATPPTDGCLIVDLGGMDRVLELDAELGLGRSLVPGYHGPRWTAEQLALLGTLPDAEVAGRTGRTPNAVRLMRERLGIPNPAGNRWTVEGVALLGTLHDREVAHRLGRSLASVTQKRCKLGIPNPCDERRRG
jgi:hypothetical protein